MRILTFVEICKGFVATDAADSQKDELLPVTPPEEINVEEEVISVRFVVECSRPHTAANASHCLQHLSPEDTTIRTALMR